MKTVHLDVLLKSDLITAEESRPLVRRRALNPRLTAAEVLDLDLPARNRVEALLRPEFLNEGRLRGLACEFANHTLYIFAEAAPGDYRPHKCLSAAFMLNEWGIGRWEELRQAVREAEPALWRFQWEEHLAAYAACRAALLMASEDAVWMAREVAACAQAAAHRKEREDRGRNVEPMVAREVEAAWQLAQIVTVL